MESPMKRGLLGLVLLGLVTLAACTGPAEPSAKPNRPSGKTVGVYRPSEGKFYLRTSNTAGNADIAFAYGRLGHKQKQYLHSQLYC